LTGRRSAVRAFDRGVQSLRAGRNKPKPLQTEYKRLSASRFLIESFRCFEKIMRCFAVSLSALAIRFQLTPWRVRMSGNASRTREKKSLTERRQIRYSWKVAQNTAARLVKRNPALPQSQHSASSSRTQSRWLCPALVLDPKLHA
jgi:hypothetical protein